MNSLDIKLKDNTKEIEKTLWLSFIDYNVTDILFLDNIFPGLFLNPTHVWHTAFLTIIIQNDKDLLAFF
jgi:hypothetical protein